MAGEDFAQGIFRRAKAQVADKERVAGIGLGPVATALLALESLGTTGRLALAIVKSIRGIALAAVDFDLIEALNGLGSISGIRECDKGKSE